VPRPAQVPQSTARAAQYLRMSTEHQRYSIDNQATAITQYAQIHGFEVVRTYADEGVSGLSIKNRKGLQQLLADVVGGVADYQAVLVYDVSRWGRFQNPDQSAHYEFLCSEAGVHVEYCAELFPNDGSVTSTILKGLKRVMAAEYSRELSVKIAKARAAQARRGYWVGGPAGYGLRRQMVGPDGRRGAVLEYGEAKALQNHHVILVPGPAAEVLVVRRIYRMFAELGLTRGRICRILNGEGVVNAVGGPWTQTLLAVLLTNRKYVGELVALRSMKRLGSSEVKLDRAHWVHVPGAFEAIVDRKLFNAAQKILAKRPVRMSRAEMIEAARRLHDEHGAINHRIIAAADNLPCASTFRDHFGSMGGLCAAIGRPRSGAARRKMCRMDDDQALARLAELYERHGYLDYKLINAEPDLPTASTYAYRFGGIANAYARVGFVNMTPEELASPVGRARASAAVAAARRLNRKNSSTAEVG
jgi:DNA invertase Pin-like site-specific DNA recombinase